MIIIILGGTNSVDQSVDPVDQSVDTTDQSVDTADWSVDTALQVVLEQKALRVMLQQM